MCPHSPNGDSVGAVPVTVVDVVAFEALPLGQRGSRRAIVRWSDGTVSEALRWYDDEVLVCEGDLLGKTAGEIRSLHFGRDRDYLRAPDPLSD
jgi:hypothetical protein